MSNVFSILINTLDTIPVTGEQNLRKMLGVLSTLHQMEAAVNKPDEEEVNTTDG